MAGNRFSKTHEAVAASPATIEQQIKCIVSEIERYGKFRMQQIEIGRWHPHKGADRMHQLRSVLITLQAVKAQRDAYANREEAAA